MRRPTELVAGGSLLLVLLLPAAAAPQVEKPLPEWAGRPLADALQELRDRGLPLVFTSGIVGPGMIVETEPDAASPRQILDQILRPHGLEARAGPGGTLVVVRARPAPASSIRGTVRSRRDGSPIEGVGIRIVGSDREAVTAADGAFQLSDLPPGSLTLEVRRRGFVVERLEQIEPSQDAPTELSIVLDPTPLMEEELVVTPSRVSLLRREPSAPLALSREELEDLPHLGGDYFRALSLLPGVASNDVTAQFHLRGGRRDETRILLDGQELYETYHLQDFDNALSIVEPGTLDSVDLSTGGFPVEHGDRMSGVLDMTTRTPTGPLHTRIGAGLLSAHAGSAGTFDGRRGSWMAQFRRGSIDLAGKLLGDEDPLYWDAFGKIDYQLTARQSLRANLLHSDDELEFRETTPEGESKQIETDYESSYLWLTHFHMTRPELYFESGASTSRVRRDRRGIELEEDVSFDIRDERELEVLDLRQQANLRLGDRHHLKGGVELRRFDTRYDYDGSRSFDTPLAAIRDDPDGESTRFEDRFREEHDSLYLAERVRVAEPLTVEVGVRYDRHSQTDESLVSPRLNLAWAAGARTVLRAAWGRFTQSQRPYELQVEDGETRFHGVERSEQRVLGIERLLRSDAGRPGVIVRAEVYRREVTNPLARFENLYEPLNTFPEVEPDRVRVAPDRSIAEGFELFLRGRAGGRLSWWANYAWSSAEDEIGGERFRRRFDQTHALNLDLGYRPGPRWSLNLAWRYHTGWPTTPLGLEVGEDEEGEAVFLPVLGRRYSDRLPDYHRLDLRLSRRWQLSAGLLVAYLDIQNVYDRGNIAGFDYEIDEELGILIDSQEAWAGLLPSLGLSFEF